MNIQLQRQYGSQSMAAPLRRVLMRSAASAMRHAKPAEWHYGPGFDAARAAHQHKAFADLVAASGAEVEWLTDEDDGLADSVFTHDPSLATDHGAVILSMGKALRRREPGLHEQAYAPHGRADPRPHRSAGHGRRRRLRLGRRQDAGDRARRTHQRGGHPPDGGAARAQGIEVIGYDLPLWHGEEACLHLMSVISPLADDLALVYSPLLPAAFYQLLKARGIRLVEGDAQEFHDSFGLSLNVLPTAPREVIAVAGFPRTAAAMEAAGCRVQTFEADALCIACEGGPTCLTRPVWRG